MAKRKVKSWKLDAARATLSGPLTPENAAKRIELSRRYPLFTNSTAEEILVGLGQIPWLTVQKVEAALQLSVGVRVVKERKKRTPRKEKALSEAAAAEESDEDEDEEDEGEEDEEEDEDEDDDEGDDEDEEDEVSRLLKPSRPTPPSQPRPSGPLSKPNPAGLGSALTGK